MAGERISIENLTEYNSNLLRDANILKRNTAYTQNSVVNKGQIYLQCTVAGTTATTAFSLSGVAVGDTVTDGTATWKVLSVTGVSFEQGGGGSSIEEWQQNHFYVTNDLFIYNNMIYEVTQDFTSSTTFDDTYCDELVGDPATSQQIQALFI